MSTRVLREVLRHELLDALRDRRMLAVALLSALLPSLVNVGLERLVRAKVQERREVALEIAVRHPERGPSLIEWLGAHEVDVVPLPDDADQALRDQRLDVVLELDDAYAEDWRAGRPAKVLVAHDQSQLRAREAAARLERLLSAYAGQLGALRLTLRGVAPELASPLSIGERDVAPAQSSDPMGIMLLPFLLLMGGLTGAGMLAVDLTAGERERQSIEALLVTAAPREQIMLGKILAASAYGLMILAAQAVALLMAGGLVRSDAYQVSPPAVARVMLVLSPLVMTAAASLTGLAAFSKTVREAQSVLSLVVLAPMAPLFYLIAAQPKPSLALYAVPLLGQFQLCMDFLRGDAVPPVHVLMNLGTTLTVLLSVMVVGSRLYRREALAISA